LKSRLGLENALVEDLQPLPATLPPTLSERRRQQRDDDDRRVLEVITEDPIMGQAVIAEELGWISPGGWPRVVRVRNAILRLQIKGQLQTWGRQTLKEKLEKRRQRRERDRVRRAWRRARAEPQRRAEETAPAAA
jgi:hypothetical protein